MKTLMTDRRQAMTMLASLATGAASAAAAAPITLLVGYAPGGSVDWVARTLAPELAQVLGDAVQVRNLSGASGAIAAVTAALSAADGRTLLIGSPSELGINHLTQAHARMNPLRDFTPIGLIGSQPMVLVASQRTGVRTTAEFLAYARRHGAKAGYASAGVGTPLHLTGELICQEAGLALRHVPYRGASLMLPDILEGRVDFGVFVLSSALPYVRDGRLRAVGVTSSTRSPAAAEIPALAEHRQLEGIDIGVWFGLVGPAAMQDRLSEHLRAALRTVLARPALRKRLEDRGMMLMDQQEFAPFLKSQIERFRKILAKAKPSD